MIRCQDENSAVLNGLRVPMQVLSEVYASEKYSRDHIVLIPLPLVLLLCPYFLVLLLLSLVAVLKPLMTSLVDRLRLTHESVIICSILSAFYIFRFDYTSMEIPIFFHRNFQPLPWSNSTCMEAFTNFHRSKLTSIEIPMKVDIREVNFTSIEANLPKWIFLWQLIPPTFTTEVNELTWKLPLTSIEGHLLPFTSIEVAMEVSSFSSFI